MTAANWWLGTHTATTASVAVQVDSGDEDVTVIAGGQSAVAQCRKSSAPQFDGVAVATIEGLEPGTSYTYTVGGVAAGTLRTRTQSNDFWVALTSCWSKQETDTMGLALMRPTFLATIDPGNSGIEAVFTMGDMPYMDGSGVINGVTVSNIALDTSPAVRAIGESREGRMAHYRSVTRTPGLMRWRRNIPSFMQVDDHEYDPDGADAQQLSQYRQHYGDEGITEGEQLAALGYCREAQLAYHATNPQTVPGETYFSVGIGQALFVCTESIYRRNSFKDVDSESKRMYEADQEEWFLQQMSRSDYRFKVWVSSKQFRSCMGRNGDGWIAGQASLFTNGAKSYTTQFRRILSDSRFPRAGALALGGDEHVLWDQVVTPGEFDAGAAGISQIGAGPCTIDGIPDPDWGDTYPAGCRSKSRMFVDEGRKGEQGYVLLHCQPDRVSRYVLSSRYGLRYMGYVGTQDNLVRR